MEDTPDGVAAVLERAGLTPTSPGADRLTLRNLANALPGGARQLIYVKRGVVRDYPIIQR